MPSRDNTMPWGNAFLVQTPTLDKWGQQLYMEQKIREQRQQQENAALDNQLKSELGKVRSVDTPDIINSYSNYKDLKKKLLFDKSLQRDPLAYNQMQQAANKAYADIFTTANKSSELKDMQKQLTSDRMKNPNAYADDFGQRMATLMQTPISAVNQHPQYGDLTNWDNYRYQGSNTDFSKIIKEAVGQPKQVFSKEEPMDGGLQVKITPYNYANTPRQVKDYVLGSLATHQAGRDAAYQWDHLPENEIANTIKQYQAIPKETWQKMGLDGPQDLLPKNPDNKAENFASYQAMKYAIANEPKEGTPIFRQNLKAVKDLDFARQLKLKEIEKSNAEDLIRLRKSLNPNDTELNNAWVDQYLNNRVETAKADKNNYRLVYTPHTSKHAYEVSGDPVLAKSLARGNTEPDRIYVTEDNKIWPIFYKYEKDPKTKETIVKKNSLGDPVVDEDYSKPLEMDQARLALGYKGQTKKQLSGTMTGANKKQSGSSSSYKINGQAYSHKQLNDMGYTDDEIKQALSTGIITE